jgi:putative hydrolase of HD superfamily
MTRLTQQLSFLLAADGLKGIERNNRLLDGSRQENSAEHSWHLTLMAMTLAEHAPPGTDMAHVLQLLVTHDLVEIHAGDHWVVEENAAAVAAAEAAAAERLFALLPVDQCDRLAALWGEFEARETPEARFARALDALHPMLLIWSAEGQGRGALHGTMTASMLRARKRPALEHYPALWSVAESLLDRAVERGLLLP